MMGVRPPSRTLPLLLLLLLQGAPKITQAATGCVLLDTKVQCNELHRLSDVLREDVVSGNTTELARVTSLTLRNSDLTSICLDDLTHLPALTSLYIAHSRVGEWVAPRRPSVPRVTQLHMDSSWDSTLDQSFVGPQGDTSWKTVNITRQVVRAIPALRQLRLTDCYVLTLEFHVLETALEVLSIQGGGLVCKVSNLWLLFWMGSGQVKITPNTVCFGHDSLHPAMYRFDDQPFLTVMGFIKDARRDCPRMCHCEVSGLHAQDVRRFPIAEPEPMQFLACEGRGLTQLPARIPHRTTQLNLSNNNITDLDLLFTSEMYRRVDMARLPNNCISHLDGDLYYKYARKRSFQLTLILDNNLLQTLPMAAFRRVYDELKEVGMEQTLHRISVTGNPLRCDDCAFISSSASFYQELFSEGLQGFKFMEHLKCGGPDQYAGKEVKQVNPDAVCGGLYGIPRHLQALAITLGVVVALIATLAIIFTFRARARRSSAFRLL